MVVPCVAWADNRGDETRLGEGSDEGCVAVAEMGYATVFAVRAHRCQQALGRAGPVVPCAGVAAEMGRRVGVADDREGHHTAGWGAGGYVAWGGGGAAPSDPVTEGRAWVRGRLGQRRGME